MAQCRRGVRAAVRHTGGLLEPQPGSYNWAPADAVIQNVAASRPHPRPAIRRLAGLDLAEQPEQCSDLQRRADYCLAAVPLQLRAQVRRPRQLLGGASEPALPPGGQLRDLERAQPELFWGGTPNPREYLKLLNITTPVIQGCRPERQGHLRRALPLPKAPVRDQGVEVPQQVLPLQGRQEVVRRALAAPLLVTAQAGRPDVAAVPQELLNAHHAAKKPIWITELGWATGGHDWATAPFKPLRLSRRST